MKISSGNFKNRLLKAPKGLNTRPTSSMARAAIFNICQNEIEGARFLDVFAGSGAMGIEAISRGASFAGFIENDRHALNALKQNISSLGIEGQTKIYPQEALKTIEKMISMGVEPFDLIYIDPPYALPSEKDAYPAITLLKRISESSLLKKTGTLFIEEGAPIAFNESSLKLVSLRRHGKAHLHQYSY